MGNYGYNLKQFRESVKSVARNQYFYVEINSPKTGHGGLDITALARTTSLPAVTIGVIDVPFRGLNMRIADKPEFPEWTVTYLCTEDHALRTNHIRWMNQIYNTTQSRNYAHEEYKVDTAKVYHLSANHKSVYGYKFFGLFPSAVGEMSLAQEGGEAMQFDVTYSYDYFVDGPADGVNNTTGLFPDSTNALSAKVDAAAAELGITNITSGLKLGTSNQAVV